jgi:hypothetical protein
MATIYYPQGCDVQVPDHICDGCTGDDVEHGRVRSVGFIALGYLATILADPTDAALWTTGITNKKVIIIPEVSGTYDGGSPVYGPGYGDEVERLIGYNYTLNFKDPNYKANAAFYNALKNSKGYAIVYRTESQIHISSKTVKVTPKNPVTDDITSEVVWDNECKWTQADLMAPVDTPVGVFDQCFQYE